ncbi:sugar isomerase domain-containing protein [Gottschalkiaceae bacterium SANA]|nr:sugar isomerase domain-containing protein [Gottschalkiaceae bacterium SANA]
MVNAKSFLEAAKKRVNRIEETQMGVIEEAAKLLAERINKGGVIHIYGSGHSACFAMELSCRAGGLVPMHRIVNQDLVLRGAYTHEEFTDGKFERREGVADTFWGLYNIQKEDAFIIVSNSGRNGLILDMTLKAKEMGLPVIAVTSMEHTQSVESRHSCGKRLFELGDLVIDNCGPTGDALLEVEDLPMKVCSISSITGAYIAQALTAEIYQRLVEYDQVPPVLISYNVAGADEHNKKILEAYEGRWNS